MAASGLALSGDAVALGTGAQVPLIAAADSSVPLVQVISTSPAVALMLIPLCFQVERN